MAEQSHFSRIGSANVADSVPDPTGSVINWPPGSGSRTAILNYVSGSLQYCFIKNSNKC
jgi:hypothetical protein